MPDYKAFKIGTLNTTTEEWTPVVAIIPCNHVGIRNASGGVLWISTDFEDDADLDEIPIGSQDVISAPYWATRFQPGDTICWLKSKADTNVVKIRFVC